VNAAANVGRDLSEARFYGRVVHAHRVGDLSLAETVFEPSSAIPPHDHDWGRLCLVLEGGFAEQADGTSTRCRAGALLFQPPNAPHAQRFEGAAARCLVIQLGRCVTSRLSDFDLRLPARPIAAAGKAAWLAMSLYDEFRRGDRAAELATEGLCLAVLAELTREAAAAARRGQCPRWLEVVQALLDEHCVEPLRLAELAAAVDVHPAHLSRVFHQRLGVTATAYVRERRLEWACERLLRTDHPSSLIAVEAGFADHAHFRRALREATGMTPRELRAALVPRDRC